MVSPTELRSALRDGGVTSADLSALVLSAPDDVIREIVESEAWPVVLEELVRRAPEFVDAGRAAGLTGTLDCRVGDDAVTVDVRDGEVRVSAGAASRPRVTLELADRVLLLRLVTGSASPAVRFLDGSLRVRGDEAFALQAAGLFRVPGAAGERLDPLAVDAEAVAAVLARVPADDLRARLSPALRELVLDEVFRRFPDYLDPERTRGVTATLGWVVEGRAWTVAIDDGRATVTPGADGARVTLALDTADLLGLATGNADPAALFLTGRLTVSGDQAFALELARYFRAPSAGEIDPTAVDADRIARVLRDVPEDELRERLRGGLRGAVLEEVFRRFPDYLQLDRATDMHAVLKWTITGREDGEADRWWVEIDHGTCRVTHGDGPDPRVTIRIDAADFLRLVTGNVNPAMAFLRGRLKLKGDLGFAAALPRLFRMPSPS